MFRNPKLTRLYTTMSANEMTEDPIFVLNPDLPDVALLLLAESLVPGGRFLFADRPLHPPHRLVVALDHRFDAAVIEVADEAMYTLDSRVVLHEVTEADALHASADDEPLRDDHGNG